MSQAEAYQRVTIPCAHEDHRKIPTTQVVPDFHPLSFDEMRGLVMRAFNERGRAVSDVQCRLVQAIEGIVCPHTISGPVAQKQAELNRVFIDGYHAGDAGGTIRKVGRILGLKPGNP